MVYAKAHATRACYGRLHYVFDEDAHDGSEHRVLACSGKNISLWGPADRPDQNQSGYYLNSQMKSTRQRVKRRRRSTTEAQHLIFSFSDQEMPTSNPDETQHNAELANKLISDFLNSYLPESAQYVCCTQSDGASHKIHVHVIANAVMTDGYTLPTKKMMVFGLRHAINEYLRNNFFAATNRPYINPFDNKRPATTTKPKARWQQQLQQLLSLAREQAHSIEQYRDLLLHQHISISERNRKGDWLYTWADGKGRPKKLRDWVQRRSKDGSVLSTRGAGSAFTPSSLEQYFAGKNKEEVHDNDQTNKTGQRIQQSGRSDAQRRQQLLEQLIERQDDEQREQTRHKAGLAGVRDRDSANFSGNRDTDGRQR